MKSAAAKIRPKSTSYCPENWAIATEATLYCGAGRDQQRPEIGLPLEDEEDQRGADHRRAGERQVDPPVDAEPAQAVDDGGLAQLLRDAEEELAQRKTARPLPMPGRISPV